MSAFVHLSVHSEYSLVDGLIRIESVKSQRDDKRLQPLTARVAELEQPAIALTDRDNLFAMAKFYKAAEGAGIKPILGVDLGVDCGGAPARVTALVQNDQGLANLMQLVSRLYTDTRSASGQVAAARDWIFEHSEGLIVLSGAQGEVGQQLLAGQVDAAESALRDWQTAFGDRFYCALARCGRPQDELHVQAATALARRHGVGVVAVNDVCFLDRDDFDAHEARVCILQGRTLDDPRRSKAFTPEQYLKSSAEMAALFSDLPEAVENSVEIARRCTPRLQFGTNYLPDFPVPEGQTVAGHLRSLSEQGLDERLAKHGMWAERAAYDDRLAEELRIIEEMGFPGYFLIVADFIQWAKDNGVPVGPGRGSGAGSLIAYAIGITDLDPLAYNLLFERFLNPERVSMPDFDVDFCMEGRDRVIEYVTAKYGADKVGQIITYGSMAARAVVRDVTRVMGHPHGFGDRIAKMIPAAPAFKVEAGAAGATELEHSLNTIPELRAAYEEEDVRAVIDLGLLLEGLARNIGKHAGGVVIAPGPLTDFVPLYREPEAQGVVTQLDMKDLEAIGLVKFDFLGLRTLTIIQWAVDIINEREPERQLDILEIPKDDPAVFELFCKGELAAVFQMESAGMRRLATELQPSRFEDLIALVALFRPGPLQSGMVTDFINRKHGREAVSYPHPKLEPVLEDTYGVIVYQEQVMRIARELAGYSLGGADLLRRAMGKKKADEMARQREIFLSGATDNDIDADTAGYIFDLVQKFAEYGFNKSHSAAYALVAYQTAWLKAYYPAAFMCAVLSAEMFKTDTLVALVDDCRSMGLTVQQPDVNTSAYRFKVVDDRTICYGLGAIRGVGEGAVENICEARAEGGPFSSLFDFCRRVDPKKVNKRVFEALIQSGAFDGLGENRATLWQNLSRAVAAAEQSTALADAGQSDLFGFGDAGAEASEPALELDRVREWHDLERLRRERDALGFYLSGHPIESFTELRDALSDGSLRALCAELPDPSTEGEVGARNGRRQRRVTVVGWLLDIRRFGPRAVLTLDDRSGQVSVPLSEEQWMRHADQLHKDSLLLVRGRLGHDEFSGGYQLRPHALLDLDAVYAQHVARLDLRLDCAQTDAKGVVELLEGVRAEVGSALSMTLHGHGAVAPVRFPGALRLRLSDPVLRRLHRLAGEEAVRLVWQSES
ncbi:DNA polymerase III subunit alpha [Algiphilus sp.]|uniref:DNA polymerase III subunit alpha n=1 Tax=Algiphilus sp. TaxID=1872431 RepID=UPI0032EABDCF